MYRERKYKICPRDPKICTLVKKKNVIFIMILTVLFMGVKWSETLTVGVKRPGREADRSPTSTACRS
jgi:hypothetical protein